MGLKKDFGTRTKFDWHDGWIMHKFSLDTATTNMTMQQQLLELDNDAEFYNNWEYDLVVDHFDYEYQQNDSKLPTI